MAQLITNVCDLCQVEGKDRVEAVGNEQLQQGRRAIVVDLCEKHREDLLQALEPFFAAGRRPDQPFIPRPTTPRVARPTGEFPCDQEGCNRVFSTLQGVSMHKTRSHSMPSPHRDDMDRERDRIRNAERARKDRRKDIQEIDLVGAQ